MKNAKRHCHCPPFHGPDITNAFRVKRRNWSLLESACFSGVSRILVCVYHFAVIGKLRFVPIEITISRFSNWPRTEVTNHISKREGSRLYMRSGENPFALLTTITLLLSRPSYPLCFFPFASPPVSLAFLILTDSKPRVYERVIGEWKGTGRRKRGRRDE